MPTLYRYANYCTELLIYFTLIWGPWAFGTVHNWSIFTMNIANYCVGLLLIIKWGIRYKTGYHPSLWTAPVGLKKYNEKDRGNWVTMFMVILTIYLLGYVLTSIINTRATFNEQFKVFEYNTNYVEWLPHTYNTPETIKFFQNLLGLVCCFWALRDWMLENKVNQTSFKSTRRRTSQHQIEEIGSKLRGMMPWITENRLVDKDKN